jgi:hypothetical protein
MREVVKLEINSTYIYNDYDYAYNYLTRGLDFQSEYALKYVCTDFCNNLKNATCCYGYTYKNAMWCGGYNTSTLSTYLDDWWLTQADYDPRTDLSFALLSNPNSTTFTYEDDYV